MPLLDHFHPPLSEQRHWEGFHARWAAAIADMLNIRLLPRGYFAESQVHVGGRVEVDVAAFDLDGGVRDPLLSSNGGGAVAVAEEVYAPPVPELEMPALFPDEVEVLVFDQSAGPVLVAAVELVSPRNKDRNEARRAFAIKVASYLQAKVGVVVIDIVTSRHANLHDELVRLLGLPEALNFPHPGSLYAVAYRPIHRDVADRIDVWTSALGVSQAMPTLPLAVHGLGCLPLDLETTYSEARRVSRLG
jgi:hypothetical protein